MGSVVSGLIKLLDSIEYSCPCSECNNGVASPIVGEPYLAIAEANPVQSFRRSLVYEQMTDLQCATLVKSRDIPSPDELHKELRNGWPYEGTKLQEY